jgi:hypothetical protein
MSSISRNLNTETLSNGLLPRRTSTIGISNSNSDLPSLPNRRMSYDQHLPTTSNTASTNSSFFSTSPELKPPASNPPSSTNPSSVVAKPNLTHTLSLDNFQNLQAANLIQQFQTLPTGQRTAPINVNNVKQGPGTANGPNPTSEYLPFPTPSFVKIIHVIRMEPLVRGRSKQSVPSHRLNPTSQLHHPVHLVKLFESQLDQRLSSDSRSRPQKDDKFRSD